MLPIQSTPKELRIHQLTYLGLEENYTAFQVALKLKSLHTEDFIFIMVVDDISACVLQLKIYLCFKTSFLQIQTISLIVGWIFY